MSEEQQPKKRAPGRPKKNRDILPNSHRGIVTEPSKEENRIEMVCSYPSVLNKISGLIKEYGASDVDFIFDVDGCRLFAVDHTNKVDICAFMPGSHTELYYCKEPTRVRVSQKHFHTIFNNTNKNYSNVSIIMQTDYRSVMYVILRETLHGSSTSMKVEVSEADNAAYKNMPDDLTYPLIFTISSADFKPKITSFRDAKILAVRKEHDYVLLVPEKDKEKMNIDTRIMYPINSSIQLSTNIQQDAIFSACVEMGHVRRFASKIIGENVRIAADNTNKITFSTETKDKEGKVSVKVFIELATFATVQ